MKELAFSFSWRLAEVSRHLAQAVDGNGESDLADDVVEQNFKDEALEPPDG